MFLLLQPSNMKYGSIPTSLGDKVINAHLPEGARQSNNRSSPVQTNSKSDSEGAFIEVLPFLFFQVSSFSSFLKMGLIYQSICGCLLLTMRTDKYTKYRTVCQEDHRPIQLPPQNIVTKSEFSNYSSEQHKKMAMLSYPF